jgi:hypothetical protein
MIRSNPTAIPLRASDLKHLQASIKQRQRAADAAPNPTSGEASQTAPVSQEERGQSGNAAQAQPASATEQRKKDRAAMSVNERIGL